MASKYLSKESGNGEKKTLHKNEIQGIERKFLERNEMKIEEVLTLRVTLKDSLYPLYENGVELDENEDELKNSVNDMKSREVEIDDVNTKQLKTNINGVKLPDISAIGDMKQKCESIDGDTVKIKLVNRNTIENDKDEYILPEELTDKNGNVPKAVSSTGYRNGNASPPYVASSDTSLNNDTVEFNGKDEDTSNESDNADCSLLDQDNVTSEKKAKAHRTAAQCEVELHLSDNILPEADSPNSPLGNHSSNMDSNESSNGDCTRETTEKNDKLEKNVLSCIICDKKFGERNDLKFHMLSHIESLPADGSGSVENGEISLREISDEEVNTKQYSCVICDKMFFLKKSLIMHYRLHSASAAKAVEVDCSTEPHVISQNNDRPNSVGRRNSSMLKETANGLLQNVSAVPSPRENSEIDDSKQYKCYICDKQFSRNSSLMWHIQFHETYMYSKLKKSNLTTESDYSFPNIDIQTSDCNPNRCSICGKIFETLNRLKRHMTFHGIVSEPVNVTSQDGISASEENNEKCDICDRYFPTAIGLRRHIRMVHRNLTEIYQSREASAEIESWKSQDTQPNEDGKFACKLCDRAFMHLCSLKRHFIGIHQSVQEQVVQIEQPIQPEPPVQTEQPSNKSCQCELCGRFFSTPGNRKKHTNLYCKGVVDETGKAPNKLVNGEESRGEECNELKTTTYGEEYFCGTCCERFSTEKALKTHEASHEESELSEDGTECVICGRSFNSVRAMRIHKKSHSRFVPEAVEVNTEEGHECPICHRTFESFRGMRIHAFSHKVQAEPTEHDVTVSSEVPESCKCEYCGRTFVNCKAKAGHMKMHFSRRNSARDGDELSCSDDGIVSEQNSSIELNVSSGSDMPERKSFECRVCGKLFYSGVGLGGHMKSHTNVTKAEVKSRSIPLINLRGENFQERILDCDLCGKSFLRRQDITKHLRDHLSGEIKLEEINLNAYRCRLCDRSFMKLRTLYTHMAAHRKYGKSNNVKSNIEEISSHSPIKRQASSGISGTPKPKRFHGDTVVKEETNSDEVYHCVSCDKNFSLPSHLQQHNSVFHNSTTEVESTTNQRSSLEGCDQEKRKRRSTLVDSSYEYDSPVLLKCDICGKSFATKQGLQKHEASHSVNDADIGAFFRCVYCEAHFKDQESLVKHAHLHEEKMQTQDLFADDAFGVGERVIIQSPNGDEEHFVFEEHDGEGYECSECDEVYFDKLQMIIHVSHHVEKRITNGHQKMIIIKADPTILAPYKCRFCDERFINKRFRFAHISKRHKDDVFECDLCKKLFLFKSNLQAHCRTHVADGRYRCRFCSRCFASRWFLKRHTRRHCLRRKLKTQPEVFDCKICELIFSDKNALAEHLQIHVISYKCDNCDFECENVIELESHACIVTTEVPICI